MSTDAASISQTLKNKKGKGIEQVPLSPTEPTPKSLTAEGDLKEPEKPAFQSTLAATPELNAMTDNAARWTENKKAESSAEEWRPTPEWVESWKSKLPLQTIMRLLQGKCYLF
jgi:hypothetical protein